MERQGEEKGLGEGREREGEKKASGKGLNYRELKESILDGETNLKFVMQIKGVGVEIIKGLVA